MNRIGEALKRAREQKGISLREAANQTKIRRRYLWALEEEDYGAFPAEIYLLGFMRRYAEFLNIDADLILSQYKHEKEREKGEVQERMLLEQRERQQGMKKRYISLVSVLTILILFFVGKSLIVQREVSEDINNKQIEHKVTHRLIEMDIEVKAKDKCWLRANIDDKESFEGVLFEGENRKWSGKRIITIRVGYVPGLEILLNGKMVDIVKGSRGDVNELVFTMQKDGQVDITQKKPLKIVPQMEYLKEELMKDEEERSVIIENEPRE